MKDWKKAEATVYKYFSEKKGSFIHRFTDTHDINAQLKRFHEGKGMVYTEKKPSDFIIVEGGIVYFAEVKSTENIRGVTSSLFEEQKGMRNRIMKLMDYTYISFIQLLIKNGIKFPAL